MRIEPATLRDVDVVVEQWLDLAASQHEHGSRLATEANREVIRGAMAGHAVDGTLLVAREGGAVIGFVSFEIEDDAFERTMSRGRVQNLYVEPGTREEGVGSALLEAAEAELESSGVEAVAIEAMADNEGARRLYERRGYEPHRVEFERRLDAESDTHSNEGG